MPVRPARSARLLCSVYLWFRLGCLTTDVSVFCLPRPLWLPARRLPPAQVPVAQPSVMDDIEVWLRTDLVRLDFSISRGEWRG